jgi:initiation factor 1A
MVKNQGGNKSKKMGRKFINAPIDRRVRKAEEEGEIYAVVTKLLGNGMFHANDCDGKERLCVMRNKFRGRGKRDNMVALGTWVLIGERDYEASCSKPKCDLLEVYNDGEKMKLKHSGESIFDKLKSDYDDKNDDGTGDVHFQQGDTEKYKELLESDSSDDSTHGVTTSSGNLKKDNDPKKQTISLGDGENVDVDDI